MDKRIRLESGRLKRPGGSNPSRSARIVLEARAIGWGGGLQKGEISSSKKLAVFGAPKPGDSAILAQLSSASSCPCCLVGVFAVDIISVCYDTTRVAVWAAIAIIFVIKPRDIGSQKG